ncbi:MAG: SUMF1/EgtB/PvdO family nonheme iron enzyme [Nitrospirae bacterium]|nr:SUMF1/EgtB/PvdO family nonheme iron enzyme [Nitrospirota bacterium]
MQRDPASVHNYIAVLDPEVTVIVDKSISRPLGESIRNQIVNMPDSGYEVIDRANMDKIFTEQGFQQTVCSQPGCAVELGKILGVGKIVTGTVSRVGQTYYVSISLINVENGKIAGIVEDTCKCELDELISVCRHLAINLIKTSNARKAAAEDAEITDGVSKKEVSLGLDFVAVHGGCFKMGYAESTEMPMHEVCLDDFNIGKYEVTQAQWEKLMGSNPSFFNNCPACPVENVSYDEIQEFIAKLNKSSIRTYKLPTEAQWEYAAKGGTNSLVLTGVKEGIWNKDTSGGKTHSVGGLNPNSLGIYDMMGNVWEWVTDWYSKQYNKQSLKKNPLGPDRGRLKVIRGGCWNSAGDELYLYIRKGMDPAVKNRSNGFRLVY